ncbi:MAG TPA: aldo/keto reductase, partial [Spirochaetia bacterium]|nr:aldo/keto reductase [Spirochaetia bacterium]
MEYRYLGASGLRVSELAMGTQTFGWGVEEKSAFEMADRFVESGGNFFDTSSTYNEGTSEGILGSWLRRNGKRDSMVIAT